MNLIFFPWASKMQPKKPPLPKFTLKAIFFPHKNVSFQVVYLHRFSINSEKIRNQAKNKMKKKLYIDEGICGSFTQKVNININRIIKRIHYEMVLPCFVAILLFPFDFLFSIFHCRYNKY